MKFTNILLIFIIRNNIFFNSSSTVMVRLYELELEKSCPYGKNPDEDWILLRESCKKNIPDFNEAIIKKAFDFCVYDFKDKLRSSGDP